MFDFTNTLFSNGVWTPEFTGTQDGEISRGKSAMSVGMAAGTRVAGTLGWRAIESVVVGDYVLTFDGGMQMVKSITKGVLWDDDIACPEEQWPLRVPVGALGNLQEMYLLPEQSVLIESDVAEAKLGDPFALLPAAALEGFSGIERVYPQEEIEVFILHFERDEIVFANIGALFFSPAEAPLDLLSDFETARYQTLPMAEACVLAGWMAIERAGETTHTAAAAYVS